MTDATTQLDALLYWGLACLPAMEFPWREAPDHHAGEDWRERFRRRALARQLDSDNTFGCRIGRHPGLVSVMDSEWRGTIVRATEVMGFGVTPDWERRLRQFCEVMEVPWQDPGWHLAVAELY